MSEDNKEIKKQYNIVTGSATSISSEVKAETFKFHPYGLKGFRDDVVDFVKEKKDKGLAWRGHDQLTNSWRTPWDVHTRYAELFSPLKVLLYSVAKQLSPNVGWYLKEMWVSEYSKGSGANMHNHGNDSFGWSFCYYVKVPDDGPGLTFKKDGILFTINCGDGDLLFFRHPIDHQVFPTQDQRIIISGNFMEMDQYHLMFGEELCHDREYFNKRFYNNMFEENKKDEDINLDNWDEFYISLKTGYPINVGDGY